MSKTRQFQAISKPFLDFVELNRTDQALQKDDAEDISNSWAIGSGDYQGNRGWYREGILTSGEALTVDFLSLPQKAFGFTVQTEWADLRCLSIINTNISGDIDVGNSNLNIFSSGEQVERSGCFTVEFPAGYSLSSGNSTIKLENPNSFSCGFKILAFGVEQ